MIDYITYRISRIETIQFATFPANFINGKDVAINTSCSYNVKSDINQVRNIIDVSYNQDDKLLLVAQIACYYDIAEDGMKEIVKEGRIPVDFLRYMGSLSIGAMRGVIHAKTEGTVLNPIVMPPINLADTIKDDLILSSIKSRTANQ